MGFCLQSAGLELDDDGYSTPPEFPADETLLSSGEQLDVVSTSIHSSADACMRVAGRTLNTKYTPP
jgi:hypothetical protein